MFLRKVEPQNLGTAEEDLEDGEIKTDDDEPILIKDDSSNNCNIVPMPKILTPNAKNGFLLSKKKIPVINLIDSDSETSSIKNSKSKFKRRKVYDVDSANDDFENAALSKILYKRRKYDKTDNNQRDSRKRKDRKKKKHKSKTETKKRKRLYNEQSYASSLIKDPDDDISDALMYEILGIGGGNTLTGGTEAIYPKLPPLTTYFSDDSYDSKPEYHKDRNPSRRRKHKKDRDHDNCRDRKNVNIEENDKSKGLCIAYLQGKCFNDDCPLPHEGRPERKLELCMFYLEGRCVKKDKCLYMHSDFPCKYYYLGMNCIYNKNKCKYMHGEPLNESLRNILLRHVETAPKIILQSFRRMSREHSLKLFNKQHEILCKKYGKTNTVPQIERTSLSTQLMSSLSNANNNKQSLLANPAAFNDLVKTNITPAHIPTNAKPKKSRWASDIKIQMQPTNKILKELDQDSLENKIPGFLNLKCLNGILRPEQIHKLVDAGVETLQQLTSLNLLQLNMAGLTIEQVHEIQLNTWSLDKLGIFKMDAANATASEIHVPMKSQPSSISIIPSDLIFDMNDNITNKSPFRDLFKTGMKDIDMRVLPSSFMLTDKNDRTNKQEKIVSPELQSNIQLKKSLPNKPSNNNNTPNYLQYLKDSHIEDYTMDLNLDNDKQLGIKEDEDEMNIDESVCDSHEENGNGNDESVCDSHEENGNGNDESVCDSHEENGKNSGDGSRPTVSRETNFDVESNLSLPYLQPPVIPAVFDINKLNRKKVIDLSSTVSSMLEAQAVAENESGFTVKYL